MESDDASLSQDVEPLEWDTESWMCFLNMLLDVAREREVPDIRTRLASAIHQWPETANDITLSWMNSTWDFLQAHYPMLGEEPFRTLPLSRVRNILGEDVPTRTLFCACIAPWHVPALDGVFPMPYMPRVVETDEECAHATPSQLRALHTILLEMSRMPEYRRHRSFWLDGGAGVGKSWTVRTVYRLLNRSAIVTATTASAAQTLDISTARTIHSTMGIGKGERDDVVKLLGKLRTHAWSVLIQVMPANHYPSAHTDMLRSLEISPSDSILMASHPLWILDEVSMMGSTLMDTCMRAWLAAVVSSRMSFIYQHAFPHCTIPREHADRVNKPYDTMYMPDIDELNLDELGMPANWLPPPKTADKSTVECYTSLWRTLYERIWRFIPPILFVGDFYQLPPINEQYAFQSIWWQQHLKPTRLELVEPVRQKGDLEYHTFLEKLRTGKLGPSEMNGWWQRFLRTSKDKVSESATYLHSKNNDADQTNENKLRQLNRHVYTIKAEDEGDQARQFEASLPNVVKLAVGAQIILRRNLDQAQGLVNGTRATILGIGRFDANAMRRCDSYYRGLPFRPNQFEWLDHCRPECLEGRPVPEAHRSTELSARCTFVEIETLKGQQRMFIMPTRIEMTSRPTRKRKNVTQEDLEQVVASRIQLPMILGWAVSIHRSQGMTLIDGAHIDARGLFSPGQSYVAFSRVPSANLVHLINTPSGIGTRPSPAVVEFFKTLAPS